MTAIWPLQDLTGVKKLHLSIEEVQEAYVTADEKKFIVTDPNEHIEIWSLETQLREKVIAPNSEWNCINVSSSPKWIYL